MQAIYNAERAGKCKPAILSPSAFSFAPEPVGVTSPVKKFSLTNYQNATPLNISDIAWGGANPGDFAISATTCGSTLKPLAACNLSVTFTPTAPGQRSAQLEASDDAYNTPQISKATGLAAAILTPSSVSFGTVKSGTTSKPVKFTLTNNQAAALTGIEISFAGTNPTDFAVSTTTCTSQLPAKSKCSISVTFTPGATGSRSAILMVIDDANNSPQEAQLKGNGG